MTLTNVALYEALKPTIGEEAARMIAEVVPPTRDLATKGDVAALVHDISALEAATKREFAELRGEMNERFAEARGEMNTRFAEADGRRHEESTRTIKWLLGVFVPVWVASWGSMLALVASR